jgi:hypothetical protein
LKCNQNKSGARSEYRNFIAYNYGPDHLDFLDGKHPPLKEQYETWEDVEKMIVHYRQLLKKAGIKPRR